MGSARPIRPAMAAHKPVEWVQAIINKFDEQVRYAFALGKRVYCHQCISHSCVCCRGEKVFSSDKLARASEQCLPDFSKMGDDEE